MRLRWFIPGRAPGATPPSSARYPCCGMIAFRPSLFLTRNTGRKNYERYSISAGVRLTF